VLLLDTHVWVWIVEGDTRRVGRRTRQLVARAETTNQVRVSPASLFEVTALHTSGRLTLAVPASQWIAEALAAPGVRLAELTPAVAIDAGAIPRTALPDPLDRLLVATARQLGATYVTADSVILDYAKVTGALRVQDARA
jgi:PIN domain nuclease of toxin-antitoxin system